MAMWCMLIATNVATEKQDLSKLITKMEKFESANKLLNTESN